MKVMTVFSGGLDSGTLLYHLLDRGYAVEAVSVNYNQRHKIELSYAKRFCEKLNLSHKVLDLSSVGSLLIGSSQTDPSVPVPHGFYTEASMKHTVVPNRNMLLLAAVASVALSAKCDAIAYGAHAGDHTIYPDCRPAFIQIMREALLNCDWQPLQLLVPFQDWTKGQIVQEGMRLHVPYELTWTCYDAGPVACGLCGACDERAAAFREAGMSDPAKLHA